MNKSVISIGNCKESEQTVNISINNLYKGLLITGDSGYGKESVRQNIQMKLIDNGYGLTFIDNIGSDSDKLVSQIQKRKEDIIYLDPIKDSNIGFNIFNCPINKSNEQYDHVVSNMSDDITQMIKNKSDYWNLTIGNIIYTFVKKMIIDNNTYVIEDFVNILENKESRISFAKNQDLDDVFLNRLKNQNEEYFDAIINCLLSWVENKTINQFISNTNNKFNIHESIKNNKIIILNTSNIKNSDETNLVSYFFLSRVWQSIKTGINIRNKSHFLFVNNYCHMTNDYYHRNIMSHHRQYKLGLCISLEHFNQLPNRTKDILYTLNNKISLNTGSDYSNAESISKLYENITPEQIVNLNRYEFICNFSDYSPLQMYTKPTNGV